MSHTPLAVIQFWRDEIGEAHWYDSDAALDARIRARFEPLWHSAQGGARDDWQATPEGAVALAIVLDQFPRNMFRGQAQAFATDAQARAVAAAAVARGFDMCLPTLLRVFLYLPLMHSEDLSDQDRCVALIAERLGPYSTNYPFALGHRAIIARFGRFPARNAALGRATTPEEAAFLNAN